MMFFLDFSGLQDRCVMYLIGISTFLTGDFGDYANNHNQITEIVIQEMKWELVFRIHQIDEQMEMGKVRYGIKIDQ